MTSTDLILQGDRLALARLLTQIENESPEGLETLGALYPHTGQAHLVGITGAPGTGKSTLVNQLALHLRKRPIPGGDTPPRVGANVGSGRSRVGRFDPPSGGWQNTRPTRHVLRC